MRVLFGWRKKAFVGVTIAAVLVAVASFGGCGSFSLPPPPTQEQLAVLKNTRFDATVGVEDYTYPVYSERLLVDLRSTGLFKSVEPLGKLRNPDLVVRVEKPIHGTAVIPFWTVITLGVVPTTVEEEHGYVFSIRSPAHPESSVLVDSVFRGPSTLGWAAFFLNFSSNRTSTNPEQSPQFRERLAISVSSRAPEISQLLSPN